MRQRTPIFGADTLPSDVHVEFVMRSAVAADPHVLRTYAERRLASVVRRFEKHVCRVVVRVGDINGPRRGIDSRCSITAQLRDSGRVDVEGVTAWPFASITLAAKRLNEALRREHEKAHVSIRRRRRDRFAPPEGA